MKPTELTARRAAEIWKGMLRAPKFDNGDDSSTGCMASMMARMIPGNITEERLDAFGERLVQLIMTPSGNNGSYFPDCSLFVDYGPCVALRDAAMQAGLDCEFPWKTHVHVGEGYVSVRHGYSAEPAFHYPLGDGKWLVTPLNGHASEIEKIKRFVIDGTLPEFTVDVDESGVGE